MIHAYEIVSGVLEKFRGLPEKVAAANGKSAEWYRSHGRVPKTLDPLASGNVSEVEHFMRYCRKYEGAFRGAGRMLSHDVHAALESEFCDHHDCDQVELECSVIDETCDVQKWLAKFDIDKASKRDLVQFLHECDEAIDAIQQAKASAVAHLKVAGIKK